MLISILTMTYLAGLSVIDVRQREVPAWLLVIGSAGAILLTGWRLHTGETSLVGMAFGAVPGVMLLAIAFLTKNAGIGDGIVLLQLSFLFLLERVILAFSISLIIMGLFSGVILLLKKGNRQTRMPYLPFLWLGCLGSFCFGGV